MKKNLFKKGVAMLGTISLLANVFLPGLEVFANDEVELNCSTIDGSAPTDNQNSVVAKLGDSCYTDVNLAIDAVNQDNNEVVIQNDTTISNIIVVDNKTVVLNLNGNKIDGSVDDKTILLKKGNLTIKNGTIDAGDGKKQVINVCGSSDSSAVNNAVLDITGDVVLKGKYGIILRQAGYGMCEDNAEHNNKGYGATINFNGESSGNVRVLGNITEGNSVINIGGNIEVDNGAAVAGQGTSTININDGAEISGITAIEVARATLNINGGIITATGKPLTEHGNNNGTTVNGAAIALSPYTKDAIVNVNILGGTINSKTEGFVLHNSFAHACDKNGNNCSWGFSDETNVSLNIPSNSTAKFNGPLSLYKEFATIEGGLYTNNITGSLKNDKCFLPNLDSETKGIYKYKVGNCITATGDAEIGTGDDASNDTMKFEDIAAVGEDEGNKSKITASVKFDDSSTGTVVGKIDDTTHNVERISISTGSGEPEVLEAINVTGESNDEITVASNGTTTIKVKNSASKVLGTITMTKTKSSLRIMFETLISKLFPNPTVALMSKSYKVASLKMIRLASLAEPENEKILGQDTLNLSVSPADGYNFSEWKISGLTLPEGFNKSENPTTLKLPSSNGDIKISAIFTEKPASVSNGGGSSGGGSTAGSTSSSSKTTTTNNTGSNTTGANTTSNTEEINLGGKVSEESTSTTEETATPDNGYSKEFNDAYTWAFKNGITTMDSIEKADMNAPLTRIAMAKMLSQYAINVLGKTPDTTKVVPNFPDVSAELDAQYNSGVTLAYQLGIMGLNIDNFRPNDLVTRAEFGTALSRMLYGLADGEGAYYETHLAKLMEEKIITVDTPDLQELRGYVMIMLMRSANI